MDRQDSYDLGHLMLLSYIENIERINGPDRAFLYRVHLQALDHHLENLKNLRHANISAVFDIEVARVALNYIFFKRN